MRYIPLLLFALISTSCTNKKQPIESPIYGEYEFISDSGTAMLRQWSREHYDLLLNDTVSSLSYNSKNGLYSFQFSVHQKRRDDSLYIHLDSLIYKAPSSERYMNEIKKSNPLIFYIKQDSLIGPFDNSIRKDREELNMVPPVFVKKK